MSIIFGVYVFIRAIQFRWHNPIRRSFLSGYMTRCQECFDLARTPSLPQLSQDMYKTRISLLSDHRRHFCNGYISMLPGLCRKRKPGPSQRNRRQLIQIARQNELQTTKGLGWISSHGSPYCIECFKEHAVNHGYFVNDQRSCGSPSMSGRWIV